MINLTPHSVSVYSEAQFTNLEQINPATWVADSVEGEPIATFESKGCARISTSEVEMPSVDSIPMFITEYGELTGIPENCQEALLIVSLPMKSMAHASNHPLAERMVSPYRVVRSRENGSLVLGCMGFTY